MMHGGKTGYPAGLLQDDHTKLSKWFASKPDARMIVRQVCKEIMEKRMATLRCPECMSEQVTLEYRQMIMANTWDHYCHSMKPQDNDSPSRCLYCEWTGRHDQLHGYGEQQ